MNAFWHEKFFSTILKFFELSDFVLNAAPAMSLVNENCREVLFVQPVISHSVLTSHHDQVGLLVMPFSLPVTLV